MPDDFVLNYPTRFTGQASLDEFDDGTRLTFPVLPLWFRIVCIVSYIAIPAAITIQVVSIFWQERHLIYAELAAGDKVLPIPREKYSIVLELVLPWIAPVIFWAGAVYLIKDIQRQSRNPETWSLTQNELTVWRYRGFKLERTIYEAANVQSVEMIPVVDVFRRKDIFLLIIRFTTGQKRIARRVSGDTAIIAERAVAAFRKMLDLPEEHC